MKHQTHQTITGDIAAAGGVTRGHGGPAAANSSVVRQRGVVRKQGDGRHTIGTRVAARSNERFSTHGCADTIHAVAALVDRCRSPLVGVNHTQKLEAGDGRRRSARDRGGHPNSGHVLLKFVHVRHVVVRCTPVPRGGGSGRA
ncbi:MAG: hypothetical protein COA68_12265 [Oceanobacter sp.]|nr:MAG: hypothetical protein COA68_12265 [Oceanobacter sp.]